MHCLSLEDIHKLTTTSASPTRNIINNNHIAAPDLTGEGR